MARQTARTKILDAAVTKVRQKGFCATTVDDLCDAAGVTKGAFFHHFKSKEDLGVAAARYWTETTGELFESAPYHAPEDPLDRVLAYLEFRKAIAQGGTDEFTCLVGTMAQETHLSSGNIAHACGDSIFGHAATLEADIQAAIDRYGTNGPATAASLARHTQAVLQGSFILAKAGAGAPAVAEAIDHLKAYISLLFRRKHP